MTKNNGYLTGLTEQLNQVVTKSLIYHRHECDRLPRSSETRRPYYRGDWIIKAGRSVIHVQLP